MIEFVKKYYRRLLLAVALVSVILLSGLLLYGRANWLAYQVYVPANLESTSAPIVTVLHGTGGNARTTQKWLGFDRLADQYGFIVVYPHSYDGQWDAGAGIVETGNDQRKRRDDVDYIGKIIERVSRDYQQKNNRRYLVGISDGAGMAVHLSCQADGKFAGLASVAATIPVYSTKECSSVKPLPVLFIHGKQDAVLPWEGKVYRGVTIYWSLEDSVNWFLHRNGCDRAESGEDYQQYRGEVDRRLFQRCDDKSSVTVFRVNDGGHSWPGRDHPEGRSQGVLNRDMDATTVIVEWIMQQQEN